MTLGIYGDSFGTQFMPSNNYKFWIDDVSKKLNVEYKNYCEPASSLFYTYNLFLKTHSLHDKIIFLITLPYRFTKPIKLSVRDFHFHISGVHNIVQIRKRYTNLTEIDKETLKLLEHWFVLMDDEFYKVSHELIVNDIVNKRPDVIIIPCFRDSLTTDQFKMAGFEHFDCLNDLIQLQLQSLGVVNLNWEEYVDNLNILSGHLTPELNEILGQLVYSRIVNGKWGRFPTKQIKHEFPWDTYYTKL